MRKLIEVIKNKIEQHRQQKDGIYVFNEYNKYINSEQFKKDRIINDLIKKSL